MSSEGLKKIGKIKMVSIPEKVKIPSQIPASKLHIPSTYAEGDVEYEDDEGNNVNLNQATHLKFTARDERSDLVVGPVEKGGMFKWNVYMDDENHAVKKENASHKREVILNEDYRAIVFKKWTIMLTLNRNIKENIFEFVDEGWLFNYMDEIDIEIKEYKDKAYVDKQNSNRNEIYIVLELDPSKYNLTESNKVDQIEEFKKYYDNATKDNVAMEH